VEDHESVDTGGREHQSHRRVGHGGSPGGRAGLPDRRFLPPPGFGPGDSRRAAGGRDHHGSPASGPERGRATGFYRPEDLHRYPVYKGDGVRFCWTNTGNEGARHYAEVMCGVDSAPLTADANQRTVVINRFVEGDTDFNSFDNLAFQPKTGNLYVVEDHHNGDVFACLPDGTDRDIKSDGCIKVLSVKDTSAEPTGFIFSADGSTAYVSIQHSDDGLTPMVDDYRTDDLIRITGFKVKGERRHHRHH
jgi:hypothetical protein